jgi:hypothetical protein
VNGTFEPGTHMVIWDLTNDDGIPINVNYTIQYTAVLTWDGVEIETQTFRVNPP